jgi:hypothetical protein
MTSVNPFTIYYSKPAPPVLDNEKIESLITDTTTSYDPFAIQDLQLYNPVYDRFFDMSPQNFDKIALNHRYHMKDPKHVVNSETQEIIEAPVFIKFSPLLDPFRYMIGKYDVKDPRIRAMPRIDSTDSTVSSKILSPHNASYVDCFFNYLASNMLHHHGFLHGIDFYGSYLGVQKQFKVCATDDIEYLQNSHFFNKHHGGLFRIDHPMMEEGYGIEGIAGSRRNRRRLCIGGSDGQHNMSAFSVCDLDVDSTLENNAVLDSPSAVDTVYVKPRDECSLDEDKEDADEEDDSTSESDSDSSMNYSSDTDVDEDAKEKTEDDDEWTSDSDFGRRDSDLEEDLGFNLHEEEEEEETEEEIYGYIRDFPIQMICLEKCEGTLDELFVKKMIDEKRAASALFQIIMMLYTYQKTFQFTHNDLHTNNIMWKTTDKEYVYYKVQDKIYKVPTYGRIYKIIDFGRSIYTFQGKRFCSDSFGPGGDASTQYNIEPFFNENKPRLEPNYAFDLCRLGSSIYDFIIHDEDDSNDLDEFQQTIVRWCLDDHGKNILYKKNGEERYPNFKLYKMIARTVHEHTPEAQLAYPFFKQFLVSSANVHGNDIMNLDTLPNYV